LELQRECRDCIFKWVYERTEPYVNQAERPLLAEKIMRAVRQNNMQPPNTGLVCNRAVYSTREIESGAAAYYQEFRREANNEADRLLVAAGEYIAKATTEKETLERAFFVAAAGNVSPLGAPSSVFTFPEIVEILKGAGSPILLGDLYHTVLNARRILYITDNAGEVGFDSLVLKLLKKSGAHVTLVVKEDPFFEDALMSDALHFELDKVVDKIIAVKGFSVMSEADPSLNRAFRASDLIVAKGTGGYEALRGETEGKKAVFMLKVKCGPISRDTGIDEGEVLVKVES
jgi:damage-control phosphatase, subfamily I